MSINKIIKSVIFVSFFLTFFVSASAQELPNVRVSNIFLEKSSYLSGEKVKGSFVLSNAKTSDASDVYYEVSLVGDYGDNTLAETFYDAIKFGPIYLRGGETRGIEFEYDLPAGISGDKLGIQIGAMLGTGFRMGWSDAFLSIKGKNTFLSIPQSFISISDEDFDLQIGPIVYPEEEAYLQFSLSNPASLKSEVFAKSKVYNRANPDVIAKEESLSKITVSPRATSTLIKYKLPKDFVSDGVYVGTVEFFDSVGNKVAPNLDYRYILGKDFVTIRGLTLDKTVVDKDDEINVALDFSGAVFDVRNSERDHSASYDLSITLFSESNREIASYSTPFDFNQPSPAKLNLKALETGVVHRSEILAKNGEKIVANYTSILPRIEEVKDYSYLYYIPALLVLILGFVVMLFRRKKKTLTSVSLVIVFLASSIVASAFTVTSSGRSGTGDSPTVPSIYVNAPTGTYTPNQQFYLTGSVSAYNCDNQYLYFKVYYKRNSGDAWTLGANYLNKNGRVSHGTTNIQRTSQFSIGPFNAPASVGSYNMYVKVEAYAYWNSTIKTGESSYAEGYQPYSVATFTLTPSTGLSCDTASVNLVWNKFSDQTIYNIRINDWSSPWTTTWNGSQSSPCQNVASGDLCLNNISIGSASQGTYPNFPVQAGHTYHFWIDVPGLGISSPAVTFSVPSAGQCSSPACYLPTDPVASVTDVLGTSLSGYNYGYYRLNSNLSNSGSATFYTGTGTNITSTTTDGKFPGSYYFSGSNSYATFTADGYFQPSVTKTISLWIKPEGDAGVVFSKYIEGEDKGGFGLNIDSSNRLTAGIKSTTATGTLYSTALSQALPVGQWSHATVVINPASTTAAVKLYVNGELVGSNTSTVSGTFEDTAAPFYLGTTQLSSGVCNLASCLYRGGIDDLFIVNKVLTDCEIKKLARGANACSEDCEPLNVSCVASPSATSTGASVTWTATSTNATGTARYSWLFDDWSPINSSTTAVSVTGTYSSVGTKYATATVSDARSTTTAACYSSLDYGSGGQYSLGVNILQKINAVCSENYNSCEDGSPQEIYPSEDTEETHYWNCQGQNGGTSIRCDAPQTLEPEPNPNCSINLESPIFQNNMVPVNTKTLWKVNGAGDYEINWWVLESQDIVGTEVVNNGHDNFEYVFTTLGLKKVKVILASSTSNETYYCGEATTFATTSVALPGSLSEI